MKIIEQSHVIEHITPNILQQIEKAGRVCWKSEGKIGCLLDSCAEHSRKLYDCDGIFIGSECNNCKHHSSLKFTKMLLDQGHHAMLEFADIIVRFVTNRGVAHELVRHRLCSFAQECVIGSTLIKTGSTTKTIKELYDQQQSSNQYDKTHFQVQRIKSIDFNGRIINNKIKKVFQTGIKKIYEVETELGYRIRCTKNHRFLKTKNTFIELSNLKIGDSIMVNGRTTLFKLPDNELRKLYTTEGLNPAEIAEMYNIGYRTVINRLKNLGVFIPRKNDKNKEKYNKNHTQKSYLKMKETIQEQYNNGRVVWNKGLTEKEHPSVKRQADSLRKNHYDFGHKGELNGSWKGGVDRKTGYQKVNKEKCSLCSSKKFIEMHHIDENPKNNKKENLLVVCSSCHKKLHYGWQVGKKIHPDKIVDIRYIGEEATYDIEMDAPYHNYIANGFVVHNSTRYVRYSGGMEFIRPVWWNAAKEYEQSLWIEAMNKAEHFYSMLLDGKWRPEQAREVLPNSLKTEIVVKANLREIRHILDLRCNKKAHPQIRSLMTNLLKDLKKQIPVVFDDIGGENE